VPYSDRSNGDLSPEPHFSCVFDVWLDARRVLRRPFRVRQAEVAGHLFIPFHESLLDSLQVLVQVFPRNLIGSRMMTLTLDGTVYVTRPKQHVTRAVKAIQDTQPYSVSDRRPRPEDLCSRTSQKLSASTGIFYRRACGKWITNRIGVAIHSLLRSSTACTQERIMTGRMETSRFSSFRQQEQSGALPGYRGAGSHS
jgi:hypothetical protein